MIGEFKSEAERIRYFEYYQRAMDLCPPPAATLDVESRHGVTRVYRFGSGDGQPVLAVHPLSGTALSMRPHLDLGRPVYAMDRLGEPGRSVQTAPIRSLAERAAWADEVLGLLDLDGVHLLGVSSGAWHAAIHAVHRPERVLSLSLVEPTTTFGRYSAGVLWRGLLAAVVRRPWTWRLFMRWAMDTDDLDRADVRLVLAGVDAYRSRPLPMVPPSDEQLRALAMPVLALFGGRSRVHNPNAAAAKARRLLSNAEVEVWPEATHDMSAAAVNVRVMAFIEAVDRAGKDHSIE
ncbi:alpha/beta hydrolase [Actinokineospora sp. NBRC 105648]|uniref:alpha/beta fold hydrolase n=1 Tax=Actinokineospora sp. NBRC 105648 TaxID=3032206 RepID=UPI002556F4D1|nr:alpha/beta hydrolase [Actinokineospora sp. NBRC 105648]